MVLQNIGGILLVDTAIYGIFIPMSVCFNDMRYISTISRINQRLYQHFNDYLSFNDLKWYIACAICYTALPYDILATQAWYNIRSFICRRHLSSTEGGYHIEDISSVSQGTDIIENTLIVSQWGCFHGGGEGNRSRLRARSGLALTVHRTVIHYHPVRFPNYS